MTAHRRRGFTLVELLIAVVLFVIVGASIYQLLVRTQRISREQSERVDLQSNIRAGALILPMELREVGYDDTPDLLGIAADSIAFRAVRSSGVICNLAPDVITVDTSRNYSAYRPPEANRDTLMVYKENTLELPGDDAWVRLPLTAVGPGVCAASFGLRPGLALTSVGVSDPTNLGYTIGSPIRTFEPVVYKLYQSGGQNYLGTYSRTVSGETVQPILGPLAANGFGLEYHDSAGAPTAVRSNVRSVQVKVKGTTDQKVNVAGGFNATTEAVDSLWTLVSLRNTLR